MEISSTSVEIEGDSSNFENFRNVHTRARIQIFQPSIKVANNFDQTPHTGTRTERIHLYKRMIYRLRI